MVRYKINEKYPRRFAYKLFRNEVTQTQKPAYDSDPPTTKGISLGLGFWVMLSPLRYGAKRKGTFHLISVTAYYLLHLAEYQTSI